MSKREKIKTKIWMEEAEENNPYSAAKCFCSGYDVYGELLGKITWIEYLYLLFRLELPTNEQAKVLEIIAVAIANPGIRDLSVRAAMNAGVGGSTKASVLMSAIAVGAGNLGGGREIVQFYKLIDQVGTDIELWKKYIQEPTQEERIDVWLPMEHVPGFDPNGNNCARPVLQTLEQLTAIFPSGKMAWLQRVRENLEMLVGYPLAMSGVIGAAFFDLGFNESQAEILYLLLRLPGAAAHSLEQEIYGWRKYPFFQEDIKPMSNAEYTKEMKNSL